MPVERTAGGTSLIDVLDRVLDKGIVIDAWVRVSLVGIDLITVEARVVVASIDTYLKYSEAVGQVATVSKPSRPRAGRAPPRRSWPRTRRCARSSPRPRPGGAAPTVRSHAARRRSGRSWPGSPGRTRPTGPRSGAARRRSRRQAQARARRVPARLRRLEECARRAPRWLRRAGAPRAASASAVDAERQAPGPLIGRPGRRPAAALDASRLDLDDRAHPLVAVLPGAEPVAFDGRVTRCRARRRRSGASFLRSAHVRRASDASDIAGRASCC